MANLSLLRHQPCRRLRKLFPNHTYLTSGTDQAGSPSPAPAPAPAPAHTSTPTYAPSRASPCATAVSRIPPPPTMGRGHRLPLRATATRIHIRQISPHTITICHYSAQLCDTNVGC